MDSQLASYHCGVSKEGRRLRDRLAEWDDRPNRYPEETFLWRHDFLAFVLCEIAAGLLYALAFWLLGRWSGRSCWSRSAPVFSSSTSPGDADGTVD